MARDSNSALRSVLTGLLALVILVTLMVIFSAFHTRQIMVFRTPLLGDLLIFGVFTLAVAIGRTAQKHAWLNGLLAGAGFAVPGFFVSLHSFAPNVKTWPYMLGRPSAELWMALASILVITSLVAQSVALWRERHQFFSLATVVVSIGCVIAVRTTGIQVIRFVDQRAQSLRASSERSDFDMPLPDLKLTTLDGTPIPASDLTGRVTVLDFWGTWCGACIAEFPSLQQVYKDYAANPKVRFLLVNPEIEGDTQETIVDFVKRKQIIIPVALDPGTPYLELSSKLHNDMLPILLVVDQRGHARLFRPGIDVNDKDMHFLRANIDKLLATM
jgi:thiol-disulfide isomerase/thioredoxin